MSSFSPTAGPSRASRITLPPMMMMVPSNHQRLDYNQDLPHTPYLQHPCPEQYEYDYEFAPLSYHPSEDYQLPQTSSAHTIEVAPSHNLPEGSTPLSLSLLLAAANAAQADTDPYATHSPINFHSNLPLACRLGASANYSAAVTSPDPSVNWPSAGLGTSDSDRFAPSLPQTPLNTPEVLYDPSMVGCCRSYSDDPCHPHETKWIERIGSEPAYSHKPSLPPLSHIGCSDPNAVGQSRNHFQPMELLSQNSVELKPPPSQVGPKDSPPSRPAITRAGRKRKVCVEAEKQSTPPKTEAPSDSEGVSKTGKPKQGRKKRSPGYVRPIITQRKRVGQRLLDMLKSAPVPSKGPSMELKRARCFPFADMKTKLRDWYGLQIEWPLNSLFSVDELRSTRRMRLDELERLDKTLDGGGVRLRLSEEVLAEEPHRANEFSVPSDGLTIEEQTPENCSTDHDDYEENSNANGRGNKRRRQRA